MKVIIGQPLHPMHLIHRDVGAEMGIVPGEQVVVVDGEGASGEVADIVGNDVAGGVVFICEELDAAAVVSEKGVGGLHDAAGLVPEGGGCRPAGADGIAGVLDGGVGEDDSALLGGILPRVDIPLHDDALPHLPVTRVGECPAVHYQCTARTHDDAGVRCTEQSITNC